MNKLAAFALIAAVICLTGCQTSFWKGTYLEDTAIDQAPVGSMAEINALYASGDYQGAFDLAAPIGRDTYRDDRYEAAYIAGLSALKLADLKNAEKSLSIAIRSANKELVVDAADALGEVYSRQGRYFQAKEKLLWAAERLTGERQARSYFFAGIAQQKLDEWSQARATLLLASGLTKDPAFKSQINSQIGVTGWTLQVGAFAQPDRARAQAEQIAQKALNLKLGPPRLINGRSATGTSVTFVHVGQFMSYQSATRYRDALGQPGVIIRALTP